jgi:hypothetical protein
LCLRDHPVWQCCHCPSFFAKGPSCLAMSSLLPLPVCLHRHESHRQRIWESVAWWVTRMDTTIAHVPGVFCQLNRPVYRNFQFSNPNTDYVYEFSNLRQDTNMTCKSRHHDVMNFTTVTMWPRVCHYGTTWAATIASHSIPTHDVVKLKVELM